MRRFIVLVTVGLVVMTSGCQKTKAQQADDLATTACGLDVIKAIANGGAAILGNHTAAPPQVIAILQSAHDAAAKAAALDGKWSGLERELGLFLADYQEGRTPESFHILLARSGCDTLGSPGEASSPAAPQVASRGLARATCTEWSATRDQMDKGTVTPRQVIAFMNDSASALKREAVRDAQSADLASALEQASPVVYQFAASNGTTDIEETRTALANVTRQCAVVMAGQ